MWFFSLSMNDLNQVLDDWESSSVQNTSDAKQLHMQNAWFPKLKYENETQTQTKTKTKLLQIRLKKSRMWVPKLEAIIANIGLANLRWLKTGN